MLPTFQKWTFCKGFFVNLYGENDEPSIWGKRYLARGCNPVEGHYLQGHENRASPYQGLF